MKKPLSLCIALLVVPASAALAQFPPPPTPGNNGIDLTWDNCILAGTDFGEPPAVANKNFNCVNTPIGRGLRTYRIHGSYKTPTAIPDFIAMDISIDLQQDFPYGPLVPFFHYETDGCANAGIILSVNKSTTGLLGDGLACSLLGTAWGDQGQETVFSSITDYFADFHGILGWGRLVASVARSPESPFNLEANVNYYGFHLSLTQTNALRMNCAGCARSAVVVWNSATLYGGSGQIVVLSGPSGKGLGTSSVNSYCAMINGPGFYLCAATPTRNTTWGQLKTLYR